MIRPLHGVMWLPLITGLIGGVATTVTAVSLYRLAETRTHNRFEKAADRVSDMVGDHLRSYVSLLHGGAGLFSGSEDVSPDEFARFASRMRLHEDYPGAQGIGFARRVLRGEEENLLVVRLHERFGDQMELYPENPGSDRVVVEYLEPPTAENRKAIGFDIATEAARREAFERARDTGLAAASGPLRLVQDTAPGAEVAFVVFVAVFEGGVVPDGLEPRRRGLIGYIYTPFRMGDLMRQVIRRGESEGLAFTISDVSSGVAEPMYASHDPGVALDPGLTREATLAMAGRQWRIATSALRGFRDSSGAAAAWVAGSLGGMLTAAVMGITFVQSRSRLAERAAAERLERGERRYRSLVAATASIVWTSGPDGSFTEPQPSWEAYTGQPWEEHRGRGWLAAVHEADRARVEEAWSRAAAQGSVLEVDGRIWHRATGSYRWFNLRGVPIARPVGHVAEWVGLVQDIQERRHLEENLLQSRKLESLGRLAGGIAHDFNNLLTAIVGSAELAMLDPGLTPAVADYLRTIMAAAERSGVLTGHLLSFARRQVIEPRNVSLTELVRGVTPILRRLLGDNIRLTVKVAEDLGVTRIDPGQFEQVLVNLATNARDAMPSGGVLTVETANADLDEEYARTHQGVTAGRYVMLLVADTGVGMDEAVQAHMFEPFFTTKEAGKGTGLGLATCYGIVRQAGGSIWVYSEPGKGTLFRIFLPRVAGQAEASAAPADEPPSTGTETLLLVEDEPMVAAVAASALRSQGYRVLFASSGEEAVAVARAHPGVIDLLVTDVVLPQMNGRELADRLRAVRPQVRVLFCSGYTDSVVLPGEAGDSGWRAGSVAFLQKPYTPKLLARRVRAVLDAQTPVGN